MPQSYRFEISPNNRAGCQNKECKDAGLKVTKGELRFGTWVEFTLGDREVQQWKWRHWSCITPTVIQNLLNALGGLEGIEDDLNVIDGYDEVPQEWQEKIRTMLREGHVPDEDWKGDVEQNRPGKRGSHKKVKAPKKKAANDEGEEEDHAEGTPTKAKAAKGRGKKVKTEANGDGDDDFTLPGGSPAPKKRRAAKFATDDEGDGINLPHPEKRRKTPKSRKSGHLALVGASEEDEEAPAPDEKPAKKSRPKKVKVEDKTEGQINEPKNNGVEGHKSRVGRNARRKKAGEIKVEEDAGPDEDAGNVDQVDGTAESTINKPVARRGRPRKVKIEVSGEDAGAATGPAEPDVKDEEPPADVPDQTEVDEMKPKAKMGRKKGVAKTIAKARPKPDY